VGAPRFAVLEAWESGISNAGGRVLRSSPGLARACPERSRRAGGVS